jgi:CheY-like chemotaxis protein
MPETVVLVVEDEALLRLMAVTVVEDAGFKPIEACNADQAVRILRRRLKFAMRSSHYVESCLARGGG